MKNWSRLIKTFQRKFSFFLHRKYKIFLTQKIILTFPDSLYEVKVRFDLGDVWFDMKSVNLVFRNQSFERNLFTTLHILCRYIANSFYEVEIKHRQSILYFKNSMNLRLFDAPRKLSKILSWDILWKFFTLQEKWERFIENTRHLVFIWIVSKIVSLFREEYIKA